MNRTITGAVSAVFSSLLVACGPLSPTAIQDSWKQSYKEFNSLSAIARNVCLYQANLNEAKERGSEDDVSKWQAVRAAQEQLYASTVAKYEAALQNPLDRGLTKPLDLPRQAPDLSTMKEQVCR